MPYSKKNILIAGGTGSIGKYLANLLQQKGFRVSILTRNPKTSMVYKNYYWNPLKEEIDANALKNQQVIINLSGAGIADKFWTKKRKLVLEDSRILPTRLLINSIVENNIKPEIFINASAIGYYGFKVTEVNQENEAPGNDFLSQLCYKWEKEMENYQKLTSNWATLRLGIVLTKNEGFLTKNLKLLNFGLKLNFGRRDQSVSWIHISDLVNIILALIDGDIEKGVYNCTTPNPTSQQEINALILKKLNKKTLNITLPENIFRWVLGDMAQLFFDGQRVMPHALTRQNFNFNYTDINSALENLLEPNPKH